MPGEYPTSCMSNDKDSECQLALLLDLTCPKACKDAINCRCHV